jgi:hypothetical protein
MSGTLKVGGKTLATHDTNTNVAKIQLGSTSDVVLTDSAGNNVLSESGGTVTLTADEANVGSNALVVDSSGNVGVGTSSPATKFDVASGNITMSNSTNAPYINFVDNTTRSQSLSRITMDQISGTAGQLLFSTTTGGTLSERMRIDSSGNINLSNNYNFARVRPTNPISFADDASIQVTSSECGSSIVSVYDFGSGHGISCFVCYATTAIILGKSTNAANSDTDGYICIYKSANSHTTYVKNRLGSTRTFSISVIGAYTQT